ncbi:MAG: hypothetical protein JKY93_12295 [Gammaproteobacteria bacterium]|nr:hypothetical protein [Gammaproteobacteria bacterium]
MSKDKPEIINIQDIEYPNSDDSLPNIYASIAPRENQINTAYVRKDLFDKTQKENTKLRRQVKSLSILRNKSKGDVV